VTVEPGRGVAVSPGGGSGVARREEPVLSVALAGTFSSSRAAQVLNPVQDEVIPLTVRPLLQHPTASTKYNTSRCTIF